MRFVFICCLLLVRVLLCGASIDCNTTYSGRTLKLDSTCPDECPFWAEVSSNATCNFRCVEDFMCGTAGLDETAVTPDSKMGTCRTCQLEGCLTCSVQGSTCDACAKDYTHRDQACKWNGTWPYAVLVFLIAAVLLYLGAYYTDLLCCRKAVNKDGLAQGLDSRTQSKLTTLIHRNRSGFSLSPVQVSSERREKEKEELKCKYRGQLYSLCTNLAKEQVAGSAFVLHMRFQMMWLVWAVIMTIFWLAICLLTNPDLLWLGLWSAKTPRELCYIVTQNSEVDSDFNWVRVVFLCVAYIFTTLFALAFALDQTNLFRRLDANVTMADFSAVCRGLPPIRGSEPVETELQSLFSEATGKKCIGVSVCWTYYEKSAEFDEIAENFLVCDQSEREKLALLKMSAEPVNKRDNLRWKLFGWIDRLLGYHVLGAPIERVPLVRDSNDGGAGEDSSTLSSPPSCLGRGETAVSSSDGIKAQELDDMPKSAQDPPVDVREVGDPQKKSSLDTEAESLNFSDSATNESSSTKKKPKSTNVATKSTNMASKPGTKNTKMPTNGSGSARLKPKSKPLKLSKSQAAARKGSTESSDFIDPKENADEKLPEGNSKTSVVASSTTSEQTMAVQSILECYQKDCFKLLTSLQTSKYAFVVFNTESDRDEAVDIMRNKGGLPYKGTTLELKIEETEPDEVNWLWFGMGRERRLKRFIKACCLIFVALLFWFFGFYSPYAGHLASYDFKEGKTPTGLVYYGFVMVVVCANLCMYCLCALSMAKVGFTRKADQERWYLITYSFSIIVNITLDVSVSFWVSYYMMKSVGASNNAGVLISDLQTVAEVFESYPMQRTLGYQLFLYCFPSTFFSPFVAEGIAGIFLPWHIQKLIVRSRADLVGRWAERAMAIFLPMDMGRYADIALNITLCVLMFFFPLGFFLPTLICLCISHVYICAYDHYRTLRCTQSFSLGGKKIDRVAHELMAMPCGILLSALIYKRSCTETSCSSQGNLILWSLAAFVLHVALHLVVLRVVVPCLSRDRHTNPHKEYVDCAELHPGTWFSCNPINCLRSMIFYNHEPPCCYYVPGREHHMWPSPELGQPFSPVIATE